MRILMTTLNSKYVHTNLALKYLYVYFLRSGAPGAVFLQEFTINNTDDYIFGELVAGNYDAICFSCYIWNRDRIVRLAENWKKARPEGRVIIGGPEAAWDDGALAEALPFAEIVRGNSGEDLLRTLFPVREKTGGGTEPKNRRPGEDPGPEQPFSLSRLPFPYEVLPPDPDRTVYYESSRGCPYRCGYCLSAADDTFSLLPLERVLRELDFFLKRNVKQVKFIDRTFNFHRERCETLIRYLLEQDNGVTNFHFEMCGELLVPSLRELLARARKGLFQLEIGIQSTCPEALKAVGRAGSWDAASENIAAVLRPGNVHIHLDLIAGLPREDFQTFGRSFDQVYSLRPHMLQLGFLKLLRGTPLRKEAEEGGNPHGYSFSAWSPYEVISNRYLTAEELIRIKRIETVLDLYYNKGGFSRSLDYLAGAAGSPWSFYRSLAEYYCSRGHQHRSHKKEDLYRILLGLGAAAGREKELENLLRADAEEAFPAEAVKNMERKGWYPL